MDYFGLFLDILTLTGQGIMHIFFVSRLTGKQKKLWHFAVYCLALFAIQFVPVHFDLNGILANGMGMLALFAVSRFALGNQRPISCLAAVLAFYISQFSYGILNSLESMIFPEFIGNPLLYLLLFAAQILFFALCTCCYRAVCKFLDWTEDSQAPNIGLILFPTLFFFAAEMYILQSAYGLYFPSISFEELRNHGVLLALQVMGLVALLCTLYAYRHLCQGFQAQAALQSLTQAAHEQKVYITEAQARYEQTKSFRHDIKNHLSVLDGLLRSGDLEEGREYLKKLEAVSEALSFPYQTGNPIVDILLGEKLGLAKEIAAEVSLVLPKPCGIDDFDLCVLFANALDNAIAACRANDGAKAIRISGKQQGDFYMLTFENTCSDEPMPPAGTGLSNIKAVAEKYHGAMLTEKNGRQYYLSVLLNIAPCNSEPASERE